MLVLRLEGFRSHALYKAEFKIGRATYVCGPNGSGKTDLYRAIRWALFAKKGDKVHPLNTSTTVTVTLHMGDIRVARTTLPDTVMVRYKNVLYKGDDANAIICSVFGTRESWELTSYVRGIHPYLLATSQRRIEILNEITEEGKARDTLDAILAQCKSELKTLTRDHEKEMIRYTALYNDSVVQPEKILTDEQRENIHASLTKNQRLVSVYQAKIEARSVLVAKIGSLKANILELEGYSQSELEELTQKLAISSRYIAAKATVDKLRANHISLGILTQEDLSNAIVAERDYNTSYSAFNKLGIQHSEQAVQSALKKLALSIEYSEVALNNALYKDIESSCSYVCKTIEEADGMEVQLRSDIRSLSDSIQHSPMFERRAQIDSLLQQLGSEVSEDLSVFCSVLERKISQQWIHVERAKYEREYSRLFQSEESSSLPTHLESTVLTEIETIRTTISNIERSKIVITCPHCSGKIMHSDGAYIPFEGVLEEGDISTLKKRLSALLKLASMKYPSAPDCEVLSSVPEEERRLSIAKRCLSLRAGLVPIPEGVLPLDCTVSVANARLASMKKKLADVVECRRVLLQLEEAVKPREIPCNIDVMDVAVARARVKQLESLRFYPKPERSVDSIRCQLKLQDAMDELARCPKPEKLITEQQIRDYQKKLASLEVLSKQLAEAEKELSSNTITKEMLLSSKRVVADLQKRLTEDKKHSAMHKDKQVVDALHDKLALKRSQYDYANEYLQAFNEGTDIKIRDRSQGLTRDVNALLSDCRSDIRIDIPAKNGRDKIICYTKGEKAGSPTELSDGELSLVSFAFRLCFCLMSRSPIIILDEVTREMSTEVKSKCVEIALDICKRAKKTLIITDHTCDSGDYDKVIDLTPRQASIAEAS